jgi:hypothetical protein
MATARQQVAAAVEQHGLELFDESGPGELHATLWSPAGVVFADNGCHNLTVAYFTDRPAGWVELAARVAEGLQPCDAEECDTCDDVVR